MKVEVVSMGNPYVLDVIKGNEDVVALTRKNADFIEAVVGLDSNYKTDSDSENPNATAYWFKQMKDKPEFYKSALKECIIKIDSANSTHLESTVNGRGEMFKIISEHCETIENFKNAINVNPSSGSCDNLFFKLCKTMENHKGQKANNISFASKFISYARKYLNKDLSFSKYDSVVSKKLSLYEHIYVDSTKRIVARKYQNDPGERKVKSDLERQKYTYDKYVSYMEAIERILKCLEEDNGIMINKEEFDHIVWYSSKGRQ